MQVTLLPAGHIFGSAQFFLRTEDGSLLYTGDFKLRPGQSAEPAEWTTADTLIMETTYGLAALSLAADRRSHSANRRLLPRRDSTKTPVPVLLGYSLGKAQEILCALAGAELTPMLHGSVYQMTRIYEQFGQTFCEYERYRRERCRRKSSDLPAEREPFAHARKNSEANASP